MNTLRKIEIKFSYCVLLQELVPHLKKAKERGVAFGRKKKLNKDGVAMLQQRRAEGVLIKTLMKDYNLSKTNIYRYLGAGNTETESCG